VFKNVAETKNCELTCVCLNRNREQKISERTFIF